MDHLPGAVEIAEQEGLVTGLVEFKPGRAHLALDLGIGDRPGEIPFEIDHDIVKVEAEVLERILFRLDMMAHQVIEADILAAGFDIAGAVKIKEMLSERRAVTVFPAIFHVRDNVQDRLFIFRRAKPGQQKKAASVITILRNGISGPLLVFDLPQLW